MAGSATLGTNLVDSLLTDVVDALRDELHTEFGVRQFRVYTIKRTYASGFVGDGSYTDVETEITPQPLVEPYRTTFELEPCGIDEAGVVRLREVSLTYTEAELTGSYGQTPIIDPQNETFFLKITDAHGQEIADTYWQLTRRPFPDRIQDIGWIMELTRAANLV